MLYLAADHNNDDMLNVFDFDRLTRSQGGLAGVDVNVLFDSLSGGTSEAYMQYDSYSGAVDKQMGTLKQSWGNGWLDLAGCQEHRTWEALFAEEDWKVSVGGLGRLMDEHLEVWMCLTGHQCSVSVVKHLENNLLTNLTNLTGFDYLVLEGYSAAQLKVALQHYDDTMCFVYNETSESWLPWGMREEIFGRDEDQK